MGYSQSGTSVYFNNFVYHANGTICTHIVPNADFTAFLNRDESKILIENAPRWDGGVDPNISGIGTFGVEIGNFINPPLQVGDSAFIRFTCKDTSQQAIIGDYVSAIPWFRFPLILNLKVTSLPPIPQNVSLSLDSSSGYRTVSWAFVSGFKYNVYRRQSNDTLPDGRERMLYHRIAQNLSSGNFTDSAALFNIKYGYIIFATSTEGFISSHSEEVTEAMGKINDLTLLPRATNIILKWISYNDQNVKGYNIYRRTENTTYGSPIAYTSTDTIYIDTRLTPGTKYYYKIKARKDSKTEIAVSEEAGGTTQNSTYGYYSYANLKIAVVIYQNTNRGGITDTEVEKIKKSLDLGKLFYWRNSFMKLNVEFTYIPIKEYKIFPDPNKWLESMMQTANDLAALGVMNTQYDIIFRITRAVNGFWSYGVQNLNLPGPSRNTGFSHVQWPVGTGVVYPGNNPNYNYGLVWLFVHEVQHAIDALYDANGIPEMYHGDVPWEFPVPCGEHFDFQAKIFRNFESYESLLPNWGNIYEAVDNDNDGFPDDDPKVALDELRFGSSASQPDTDFDGLSDRREAYDGTYGGSDPLNSDTDADGIVDGSDRYPRYPLALVVPNFKPVLDGVVELGWPLVDSAVVYSTTPFSPKLFMSYDNDSLYIAMKLSVFASPTIYFDFQADGWWWGAGNTEIKLNLNTGTIYSVRSWDASPEVRSYSGGGGMWDDESAYQQKFNRRVIYLNSIKLKVQKNPPQVDVEMAIAKREYAGLNLRYGDKIGFNIYYAGVNNSVNNATTFDQYDFG
ncbi:MAG: fibronectin type III domain-containing protein, partial [Bacteroidota bacterium]|nr:fibronectin type III domain-containing protein [Bacteroidota bacterium]